MAWAGQRGREKDRNFNASCQSTEKVSAIVRRMGWAVILRGESGPRRSGSVGFGGLVGGNSGSIAPVRECGGGRSRGLDREEGS